MTDRDAAAERAQRRRQRLAALGDTSTGRSADDLDEGWSEPAGDGARDGARDEELRRDVPPHHG